MYVVYTGGASDDHSNLGPILGGIGGIIGMVLILIVIIIFLALLLYFKRKRKRKEYSSTLSKEYVKIHI